MKKGWQTKTICDVCEFQRGLTYAKGDEVDVSDNVVLRATNIDLATNLLIFDELKYISDKVVVPGSKKVKQGSLMICMASGSKSHLGKVAFIDDDYGYAFGGFMGMLTPLNGLLPKYLFHLMTSEDYKDFIGALSDGANINNLTFDKLKVFPVPVPPLAEQQRIVGLLDEAFEGLATARANAEKNLQNARALFESILDAAISGKVTEEWRESHPNIKPATELLSRILGQRRARWNGKGAYPNPPQPKIESLPILPSQWTYVTIEQLLRDDSGLSYGILKPGDPDPQGVPMVRVMDIGHGKVNDTEILMVSKGLSDEFKRTILEEDDIMLAVMATVGRCAIVPPHLIGANVNRALAVLKLNKLVNVQFILFAILSPRIQGLFQKNKMGAAQARINLGDLRNYAIPLPPLPEQEAIAAILSTIFSETQRLARLYERKHAALEALKKSLLHQAFTGELL